MKNFWLLFTSLFSVLGTALSKAIIGVDLGSVFMKVALVQRNAPLEIVTNLHSKRKTEQMVLFDSGTRFYGSDASSLIARKPFFTPTAMNVMLGRDEDHPAVKVLTDRYNPILPSFNASRNGVCLTIKGDSYTPEELVAMTLEHAKDITAAFGQAGVRDCVLTVPSFYTQHERMALLDAAALAGLNVLSLIDENTAAALHFGMDRIDEEKVNILFYNMGASALQVSIIQYSSYEYKDGAYGKKKLSGAFEVKGKGWDSTLGGSSFDTLLVDYMADDFNEMRAKKGLGDVRDNLKAMTKLRLQAVKAKHVLSANMDTHVFVESLADDMSYQKKISRKMFEDLSKDLVERSTLPIQMALDSANMTLDDVDTIEFIGGGMRVPLIQKMIKEKTGKEIGLHINSDESMALGAAFHGANVSTAFKVRHVGMQDVSPFPVAISLMDMEVEQGMLGSLFGNSKTEDEVWTKKATLFKGFGRLGIKKTIAFTHGDDVSCALDYEASPYLPEGSETSIVRYNITGIAKFTKELKEKNLPTPKVALQFELSNSGLVQLLKAEAVVEEVVQVEVEEEYEEDADNETSTVNVIADENGEGEKSEVETDTKETESNTKTEEGETKTEESLEPETDTKEAEANTKIEDENETEESLEPETDTTKESQETSSEEEEVPKVEEPKKVKKTRKVMKDKKKTHKVSLKIEAYFDSKVMPHSLELKQESEAKLENLAEIDRERQKLEGIKNQVESYMYYIKNKLIDDEDAINSVTTQDQRDAVSKLSADAEEWLYEDGYDADYATFSDKFAEISTPMEEIIHRVKESVDRPKAIADLKSKLEKVEKLLIQWEETMPQITDEEKSDVREKSANITSWAVEMEEKQNGVKPWETPSFLSSEVSPQFKSLERLIKRLNKKPKPKPIVEKSNETEAVGEGDDSETAEEGEEKSTVDEGGDIKDESEGKEKSEAEEGSEAEATDSPKSKVVKEDDSEDGSEDDSEDHSDDSEL